MLSQLQNFSLICSKLRALLQQVLCCLWVQVLQVVIFVKMALQKFLNIPFCFTCKSYKEVEKCHVHLILVTALSTTLQISSRAPIYRFCFEHFPFITRSFSQYNIQRPKACACQKSFFFFFCLQCHLHQSLQRAWKRLQSPGSPVFCGVWFEKFFYQKCHKNFFMNPIKFCALVSIHSQKHWHCLNISVVKL